MNETEKIRNKYDRFSRFYDKFENVFEKRAAAKWRKELLSNLEGNILEIGVGTGKNLQYYGEHAYITGIDFSPGMLKKAYDKLDKLNNQRISLKKMDAEKLSFPDNHFDYVITTFVLCSIPHPVKALKEIRRVIKPNGKFIAIEHVLSKNFLISLHQHIFNPFTKHFFGFNVNRNTIVNMNKSGLKIVKNKNLAFFDVFKKIIVKTK